MVERTTTVSSQTSGGKGSLGGAPPDQPICSGDRRREPTRATDRRAALTISEASPKTVSYRAASSVESTNSSLPSNRAQVNGGVNGPVKCSPFDPVLPPFQHDGTGSPSMARSADRAVLIELRRFLAGIHAILETLIRRCSRPMGCEMSAHAPPGTGWRSHAKCPPFDPVSPPFQHDRTSSSSTARSADRAALIELRRFLAGIHAILETPDKRAVFGAT